MTTAAESTGARSGDGAARWLWAAALVLPLVFAGAWFFLPGPGRALAVTRGGSTFPQSELKFTKATIGPEPVNPPWMTNVKIVDFDNDGRREVLACDARLNCVWWYRPGAEGAWEEHRLAEDIVAPAHATVTDLDGDGANDLLVAELGSIWPDDGVIGRVILLRNVSAGGDQAAPRFEKQVLLSDVRRVSDVQAADLNGDGRTDLVVAAFGYDRGEVLWLENMGDLKFREHSLHSAPGAIHVPLADFNGDGRTDIITIVSQDEEELWGFENLGDGKFQSRMLWTTPNFDLGSAGLIADDLDKDGLVDLVLPVGDNLEDIHSYPQPYHGCFWFKNLGDWKFEPRRIATFGGTYAAAVGDLNGDGHRDVVLVSMFNDWDDPAHGSVIWLENDGKQNFRPWQIDSKPTHLVTVDCGDLNGDGLDEVVAGGLHLTAPFDRLGRITRWSPSRSPSP